MEQGELQGSKSFWPEQKIAPKTENLYMYLYKMFHDISPKRLQVIGLCYFYLVEMGEVSVVF